MKEHFKNILIVRTDRIGDVVLTSSILKPLKLKFPSARISILVSPLTLDLVKGNPCLDEVIVDDRRGEHRGVVGFIKLIHLLRQKSFDLAIIFHTKKRTNAICFLAGIPNRMGYQNNKFGFLLNKPIKDSRHLGLKHEAEYCFDVLSVLRVEGSAMEVFVPLQNEAELWAKKFVVDLKLQKGEMLVAIHLGASDPAKCWPLEQFVEVVQRINTKYLVRFLLVGGKEEARLSEMLINNGKSTIVDLTGKTSIAQLASILKRCRILISNDSGPVHVADGVGTPVISIFTRNAPGINPERWRPLGAKSKAIFCDPSRTKPIQTEQVVEAVDAVLKLC